MSAAQDPKMQQLIGQNPQAAMMQAALAAHVQEHLAFEYRRQLELMAGVPLPAPDEELDEEMEINISRLAAAAAQKLLAKDQAEVAQQQAQQQAQDPLIQMQQQELQIKAKETEIKEKKLLTDAAAKADQIEIERERLAVQERIAGLQVGAKVAKDKTELQFKQAVQAVDEQIEGVRMGMQMAQQAAQQQQPQTPAKKETE